MGAEITFTIRVMEKVASSIFTFVFLSFFNWRQKVASRLSYWGAKVSLSGQSIFGKLQTLFFLRKVWCHGHNFRSVFLSTNIENVVAMKTAFISSNSTKMRSLICKCNLNRKITENSFKTIYPPKNFTWETRLKLVGHFGLKSRVFWIWVLNGSKLLLLIFFFYTVHKWSMPEPSQFYFKFCSFKGKTTAIWRIELQSDLESERKIFWRRRSPILKSLFATRTIHQLRS